MFDQSSVSGASPSFIVLWTDPPTEEIISVSIRYVFSFMDKTPDWSEARTIEMKLHIILENPGHAVRRARIAIPDTFKNASLFLYHSFFIVERHAGLRVEHTPITTDEIVCDATFTYYDLTGSYTHMCIKWTLDGWRSFTWSPMEVDGIDESSEVGAHHLYDAIHGSGIPDYFSKRVQALGTIPWPHLFRGRVFAPRGARMDYCFHMVQKTPSIYNESWDNNFGLNFNKVLRPSAWEKYPGDDESRHSVIGNMRRTRLRSTIHKLERDIWVCLPPAYQSNPERQFPVLYMNDGQNLFDDAAAFGGTAWGVGKAVEMLSSEGLDIIVVGIENGRLTRDKEFTSFANEHKSGAQSGNSYLDFIVHVVDPEIRRVFRIHHGKNATGIMGSSFGGLISIAAFFTYPKTFGFCASLSNWMWLDDFIDGKQVCQWFSHESSPEGFIYLDYVPDEVVIQPIYGRLTQEERLAQTHSFVEILHQHGFQNGKNLSYREYAGLPHCESEWGRRFPNVIRWFAEQTSLHF